MHVRAKGLFFKFAHNSRTYKAPGLLPKKGNLKGKVIEVSSGLLLKIVTKLNDYQIK